MNPIPFNNIRKAIEEIFPNRMEIHWHLTPNDIHQLARSSDIDLQWVALDWWHGYEYGLKEYDDEFIIAEVFREYKPEKGRTLVVTDECFKDQLGFEFDFEDLSNFIEEYEDYYNMGFFQPLDCIFVFPEEGLLTILHHEGYRMQYIRNQFTQ